MAKQISPGVVVVVIIIVVALIVGVWFMTRGAPKKGGWEGPVPKATPPSAGGGPIPTGGAGTSAPMAAPGAPVVVPAAPAAPAAPVAPAAPATGP